MFLPRLTVNDVHSAITPVSCNGPHPVSSCLDLAVDSNTVDINVTPPANEWSYSSFAYGSNTVNVRTNAPGYRLDLSAKNGNGYLERTPSIAGATDDICSFARPISNPIGLMGGCWGFTLDDMVSGGTPTANANIWAGVQSSNYLDNTIKVTANSSEPTGDNTTIYYGVNVFYNQLAGLYTADIMYTVTANPFPTPTITSVSPNSGYTSGGNMITIHGTNFYDVTSTTHGVFIGDISSTSECTSLTVISPTEITCIVPPQAEGTYDVVLYDYDAMNGRGHATLPNGYTYIVLANVTSVIPSLASTIAGTESGPAFTIVGSGFTGVNDTSPVPGPIIIDPNASPVEITDVKIGGVSCSSFEIVSDTHIFCKAPNTINTTGNKKVEVFRNGVPSAENITVAYSDTAYPTLQASNAFTNCSTAAQLYRDERDSQLYYVKKMPDNKCWMVDNLKYANYGTLSQETGNLTVDGTGTQSAANYDVAKYVDPGATGYCMGNTNMPANTNTKCGLLYNWYAATGGTGTYAVSTDGTNVSGSICPANFRLPSAMSNGTTATSNGTSVSAADFPVLNASMNAGALTTGSITSYPTNWQPSGSWGGTFSGAWNNALYDMGSYGYFWSSTANSATRVHALRFTSSGVYPNNGTYDKYYGFAVRCVMEDPTPVPPAGSNPTNISSTNPAVLDVYPTTGWAGDTVAITSKALFTNVSSVTIGGTACTKFGVITTSLITCTLPAKTAGTTNDIVVTNNGTNVTPASTYNHMRITYFNPDSSTVNISGTTYNFYPNGFTSSNCSAMTPSNAAIGSTPAASMVYVRDTRNNQTYKVKKMVDNKCWMVDNLKYISTNMTFNNGDHLNNGGTTAYNTIDETITQSDTNSNKAFYNNPMYGSYCYSLSGTTANTLTSCGYTYNYYAATNGMGTYAQSTEGTNVTVSICPANFRLPSSMSNGSTAAGNGGSYNAADFAVLNASMNAGALATPGSIDYTFYARWFPSGAWGGTFSGAWYAGFGNQGSMGYFWSSTIYSAAQVRDLNIAGVGSVSPIDVSSKYHGLSVRCVMP